MTNDVGRATRGVLGLSLGTFIVQAVAAGSQLVLALWLTPSQFGYWASAVSAMTLVTALTNFGEVSGYLSGQSVGYRATRARAFRANLLLVLIGLVISSVYLSWGKGEIALYCLVLALAIPLSGDVDIKIAAMTRHGSYRAIVSSQAVAACVKFGVGVLIAISTRSAIAIAIAAVVYYLTLAFLISKRAQAVSAAEGRDTALTRRRERLSWAVNSYAMSLPIQAVFLAGQAFLTPADLGVLYIAMQVTLALSGLISVPLNRVALSTLARADDADRDQLVAGLGVRVVGTVTVLSAGIGLGLVLLGGYVPTAWQSAVPFAIVLLAGLPLRILSPVLEARQQSAKAWWHATGFSLTDAIGTAAVVMLAALLGDLLVVCLAVTVWKALVGIARTIIVLRRSPLLIRLGLTFAGLVASTALLSAYLTAWVYVGVVATGLVGALILLGVRRKRSPQAGDRDSNNSAS